MDLIADRGRRFLRLQIGDEAFNREPAVAIAIERLGQRLHLHFDVVQPLHIRVALFR